MLQTTTSEEISDQQLNKQYSFQAHLDKNELELKPISISTLQVNVTKLCNQACLHCHVDASPKRTEAMDKSTIDRCLEVLAKYPEIQNLDITGGAPELNPYFDYLVIEARKLGKHVMSRHNLTVTIDGNPVTGESKAYLPKFYANNKVEVISSLPCYQEASTDKQRGRGVYQKSIEALKLLNNEGYGKDGSGLVLNLVHNPVGASLPGSQKSLQEGYKKQLKEMHNIDFNELFVVTNMPIHRFKTQLKHEDGLIEYMNLLTNSFNPNAANNIMCRFMLSVSYDGRLYDCDFNQMLDMQVEEEPTDIFNFNYNDLLKRRIRFAHHCFGCTAGAGSSCGGELSCEQS